jgi:hypothetical protein
MVRDHHFLEQMFDYGGGGGGSGSPGRYFYLVLKSGQIEDPLDPNDVQKFFRSGVNTSSDYAFTVVDIATDQRLKDDLIKIDNGVDFFQRLEASVPAFLITSMSISHVVTANAINMYPIRD